jgi:hypothetical protein
MRLFLLCHMANDGPRFRVPQDRQLSLIDPPGAEFAGMIDADHTRHAARRAIPWP